jgi:hypothetical protein
METLYMKNVFFLMLSLFVVTSCASQKREEKIVEEKAAQTTVHDSNALGSKISTLIANSKDLSEAQKAELTKIFQMNKKTAEVLTEKSYAFRGVLIQELLSGKVSQKRVEILKKDIKEVEAARLKNTFDTVEQISSLVSNHPEKDKFAEHMMIMDRSR